MSVPLESLTGLTGSSNCTVKLLSNTVGPTLVLLLGSQTVSLVVWFTVLAGCYALFIPIIQEAAAQTAVAVLYTATAIIVTVTYFIVRQVHVILSRLSECS